MTCNDWWNVRLDADEFYPSDVRAFLANVPKRYRTVKKESTDYVLTHEDLSKYEFSGNFLANLSFVSLICRPLITEPKMIEEKFFLLNSRQCIRCFGHRSERLNLFHVGLSIDNIVEP